MVNERRAPAKILHCRACGDPVALSAVSAAVSCSRVCADSPTRVRKHEQRDSWICEEHYGAGMTYTEISEKYGIGVPEVLRIIEAF